MRDEDIRRLSEPYGHARVDVDRRFHSAICADVPNAAILVREILADFSRSTVGIPWWSSTPIHERTLIGDYLYQCAFGIESEFGRSSTTLHGISGCAGEA